MKFNGTKKVPASPDQTRFVPQCSGFGPIGSISPQGNKSPSGLRSFQDDRVTFDDQLDRSVSQLTVPSPTLSEHRGTSWQFCNERNSTRRAFHSGRHIRIGSYQLWGRGIIAIDLSLVWSGISIFLSALERGGSGTIISSRSNCTSTGGNLSEDNSVW